MIYPIIQKAIMNSYYELFYTAVAYSYFTVNLLVNTVSSDQPAYNRNDG